MTIRISRFDHLAVTVADMTRSIDFYRRVLGAEEIVFGEGRRALKLGANKFNLHDATTAISPVAAAPTPGAIDICLISETPMPAILDHLAACGVAIVEGPVPRTGAAGPILSVYFRDPDGNLIEVSNRL